MGNVAKTSPAWMAMLLFAVTCRPAWRLFLFAIRCRGVCEFDLRTGGRRGRRFRLVLLRFADFLVAAQLTLGHGVLLLLD